MVTGAPCQKLACPQQPEGRRSTQKASHVGTRACDLVVGTIHDPCLSCVANLPRVPTCCPCHCLSSSPLRVSVSRCFRLLLLLPCDSCWHFPRHKVSLLSAASKVSSDLHVVIKEKPEADKKNVLQVPHTSKNDYNSLSNVFLCSLVSYYQALLFSCFLFWRATQLRPTPKTSTSKRKAATTPTATPPSTAYHKTNEKTNWSHGPTRQCEQLTQQDDLLEANGITSWIVRQGRIWLKHARMIGNHHDPARERQLATLYCCILLDASTSPSIGICPPFSKACRREHDPCHGSTRGNWTGEHHHAHHTSVTWRVHNDEPSQHLHSPQNRA